MQGTDSLTEKVTGDFKFKAGTSDIVGNSPIFDHGFFKNYDEKFILIKITLAGINIIV